MTVFCTLLSLLNALAVIPLRETQAASFLLACIPFINQFPTDGILGCFQSLVITDTTAVNNFVHV